MTNPPADSALGLYRVLDEKGRVGDMAAPVLPDDVRLNMYREMRRVRILDERMLARQRQGKIGFFGTVTGQEATPIAAAFATEARDWIFPALREGAIMLTRGFPLTQWLAQVYGNAGDVLKGRQMPSHMSGRSVNQVSWSSCIGPQIPQAVGAAWAAKLKGEDTVTIGFMGDGATSQPDFHCALNFAGVFKTPSVLICQNNHWSISVPTEKQTASETLAVKAHAYGLPGIRVDGNDVLALYAVIKAAVDRARRGEGATFIEAVTYRIGPHSSSDDPTLYRSQSEVNAWKAKDPIARYALYLRSEGLLNPLLEQSIDAEIDQEISAALAVVESYGTPPRASLFEDVFGEMPWHLREQSVALEKHAPAPTHR